MDGWGCGSCGGSNPEGTRFCGHCGTRRAATVAAERVTADRPTDERRLVTALFADISGFTTLADRLDVEELHSVISPVIAGLAAVAERYDGFIAKFAGDALLVFFGAPVAREDDAERALQVALEMHAALPGLVAELGDPEIELALHIGVNTGHVVAGLFGGDAHADYSILGDAVNVAQRLESVAPNGSTYVGESTYLLAHRGFELEPLEPLVLKGKPEPVPAWRLVGRRSTDAAVPEPARRAPMVGRSREMTALLDGIGRGKAVAVVGEPGLGKSRLLAEVRRSVESGGRVWLSARCLSYGAGLAYWPFADLVRRTGGSAAASDAARPFLDRLIGDDGDGAMPPEVFRRGLQDALAEWLRSLGGDHPPVVAIEDVHWADAPSAVLAGQLAQAGIPVVVTARPEGREAAAGVAGPAVIELRPLDAEAVDGMIAALLDDDAPPGLAAAVADRTAGNPLFVEEVIRGLIDDGSLAKRNGHWRLVGGWSAESIPDSIERVLTARIDQLPMRQAALLQIAAVVGRLVRLPLLRSVTGDAPRLDDDLAELVARGFLHGTGEDLAFSHALVQEAAYERILRRERQGMHLRVARAAQAVYGEGDEVVDLLARHLYLGGAGAIAVEPLLRAGRRAMALYATDEAVVHLGRALEVAEATGAGRLPEIVLELADVQAQRGDYDEALALYRRARSILGADARSWCGEAMVRRRQGDYAGALAVVDDALAALPEDHPGGPAVRLEQGIALVTLGRWSEAVDAFRRGLDRTGDDVIRRRLLAQIANALRCDGQQLAALDAANEACRLSEAAGDHIGLVSVLRIRGAIRFMLGDLDDAAGDLTHAVDLAARTNTIEELAGSLINLGMIELARGELESAIECDRRGIAEFERLDHGSGQAVGYGNLAEKLLLADRADESVTWAERAIAKASDIGHIPTLADVGRTYAAALVTLGRRTEALAAAQAAAEAFRTLGDDEGEASCLALVSTVAAG